MTPSNIPDLLEQLQTQLTALGDGKDCRSDREYATYRAAVDARSRTMSGLRNTPADLLREEHRLATLEAARAASLEKQLELEQAIAAAPDLSTIRDGRERDREYGRQQDLQRQLYLLSCGRLLYAPGQAYEHPGALDLQITEQTARRDRAQAALDGHVRAASRLVAEHQVAKAVEVAS